MSSCKKSCCWTPFQVCAYKKQCGCHTGDRPVYERLMPSEVDRARSVAAQKGTWAVRR